MPIKLIALDLDGTLNNDQKQITPKTHGALMAAQRQGGAAGVGIGAPVPRTV